jgi:phospholipid/cholesterol/gamma-HCH transport system substrate-binding protein
MLAGVTVGYVSDVRLNPDGFLDVDLRIEDDYKVPRNAVAEVFPIGIFGDAAVALRTSGPSPVSYQSGDTMPTRAAASGLDQLQSRADTITASLARIVHAFEAELVQAGGVRELRQSLTATNRLLAQFQAIAAEQNRNLSATLGAFRGAASAVDSAQVAGVVASLRQTSANIDSLTLRLSSNTTQLQGILARMERGEGTVGKLMTDTLMYRDARNLLIRIDSLVSDFQRNPRKYINLRVF